MKKSYPAIPAALQQIWENMETVEAPHCELQARLADVAQRWYSLFNMRVTGPEYDQLTEELKELNRQYEQVELVPELTPQQARLYLAACCCRENIPNAWDIKCYQPVEYVGDAELRRRVRLYMQAHKALGLGYFWYGPWGCYRTDYRW